MTAVALRPRHLQVDKDQTTLCEKVGGVPTWTLLGELLTRDGDAVTCGECLEWMHA